MRRRRIRLFPPGSFPVPGDGSRQEQPPAGLPGLPAQPSGNNRHLLATFPGHTWEAGWQPLAYLAWQEAMRDGGRT
jgi:hypothetical protein